MAFAALAATVLQNIPWSEVISTAPKIVSGARKLWTTVSGKSGSTPRHDAETPAAQAGAPALASRLDAVETDLADLHQQMLESAELIKALADQNAQLIKALADQNAQLVARGESARRWLLGLSAATVLAFLISITAVLMVLAERYA